jgi:hypothetical protein
MDAHPVVLELRHLAAQAMASSSIRPETSSGGRFQFSEENANTVSTRTPRSEQACTHRRSDSTP